MADDINPMRTVADIVRELPPAAGPIDTAPVLAPGAVGGDVVVPPLPKKWPADMHLQITAGHLNTPVGPLVAPEDIVVALRTGSLSNVNEPAASVLAWLFVESSPKTIISCAREAGASLHTVQQLYNETLAVGIPRVPGWEEAVQALL